MSLFVIEDSKKKNHDVKRKTFPVGFCALCFEIKILHMRNLTRYSLFFGVKHLSFMLRKDSKIQLHSKLVYPKEM